MILGKLQPSVADAFISDHPEATLGSLSADGLRRINGPESLREAFEQAGGSLAVITTTVTPAECVPCEKARLGDAIKERLVQETGDTTVCDDCQQEIDQLNTMTHEEVLNETPALAGRITERAKTQASSVVHRTAARVAPGTVSRKVEGWIEDTVRKSSQRIPCGTINERTTERFLEQVASQIVGVELGSLDASGRRRVVSTQGNDLALKHFVGQWNDDNSILDAMPIEWSCAVTTIPQRLTLLRNTLKSLENSGFRNVTLFVDAPHSDKYAAIGQPVVFRGENAKTYRHWILTLVEMYARNPEADRFAIFQDDFVASRNLRAYLESCEFPKDGYWNLLTFMADNEKIVSSMTTTGWTRSDQKGKGAVGLVFDNAAVVDLLTQRSLYDRLWDKIRGDRYTDGAVQEAMKRAGRFEYVHNPSLIQHTGTVSTVASRTWGTRMPNPNAQTFKGEDFNLLALSESHRDSQARAAIAQMVPPSQHRPGIWRNGVVQIWITRACDKSCFHCTQGSQLAGKPGMITPEQFQAACDSLEGYFGVVGMFGGNCALHPKFDVLCEIFRRKFPFDQRGVWSNHPKGKGAIMRETFNPAVSNLNVHQDQEAWDEFLRDWPGLAQHIGDNLKGLDRDSRHGPPLVAMQDVIADAGERWDLIKNCDVNKNWSSMICVVRDQLRAFVCELMGSQAMLHQNNQNWMGTGKPMPDTGLPVVKDWWRKPIEDFAAQIKLHCHACGIPLNGYGSLANSGPFEQFSVTHEAVMVPKRPRDMMLISDLVQLGDKTLPVATDYIQNSGLK